FGQLCSIEHLGRMLLEDLEERVSPGAVDLTGGALEYWLQAGPDRRQILLDRRLPRNLNLRSSRRPRRPPVRVQSGQRLRRGAAAKSTTPPVARAPLRLSTRFSHPASTCPTSVITPSLIVRPPRRKAHAACRHSPPLPCGRLAVTTRAALSGPARRYSRRPG